MKKKIVIKIISIVMAISLIGGGVYYILDRFILFPNIVKAMEKTIEHKIGGLSQFDFKDYVQSGKVDVDFGINSSQRGKISLIHGNDKTFAQLDILGEHITLGMDKNQYSIMSQNFNNGKSYGINTANAVTRLDNSIFSPNSGTEYALPENVYNAVKRYLESTSKEKENHTKTINSAMINLLIKSDLRSSFSQDTKDIDILGETRKSKVQSLSINNSSLADFLERLSDKLKNLSDKEHRAFYALYSKIAPFLGGARNSDEKQAIYDFSERILTLAKAVKEPEDGSKFNIAITICYNDKAISAIIVDHVEDYTEQYPVYNEEIDAEEYETYTYHDETNFVLDFGADPTANRKIQMQMVIVNTTTNQQAIDEVKATYTINALLNSYKTDNVINYNLSLGYNDYTVYSNDDFYTEEESIELNLQLDSNQNQGKLWVQKGERELMSFNFRYVDGINSMSIAPLSTSIGEEKSDFPIDIAFTFHKDPDEIELKLDTDLLDISLDEIEALMYDIDDYIIHILESNEEFFESLAEMYESEDDIYDDEIYDDTYEDDDLIADEEFLCGYDEGSLESIYTNY